MSPIRDDEDDGPGPEASGPWLEPEEAELRLLLLPPAGLAEPARLPGRLAAVLGAVPVAAVVLDPRELDGAALTACREVCRRDAVACLLRDDPVGVIDHGADGAHLGDPERIEAARRLLGAERIVGAACGRSRHAAMVAGEAGADYVMFGTTGEAAEPAALAELVAWWGELFVLPCAAVLGLDRDTAALLGAAGVDFLASDALLADGVDDPAAAARSLLDAARGGRGKL